MVLLKRRHRSWQLRPTAFIIVLSLLIMNIPVRIKLGSYLSTPMFELSRVEQRSPVSVQGNRPLGPLGRTRRILMFCLVVNPRVALSLLLRTRQGATTRTQLSVWPSRLTQITLFICLLLSG